MNDIKRYAYIDSLRGYAVLGVVAVHSILGDQNILFSSIINLGAKGVQLFYIISAFTLFLSFENRKEELQPYKNFIIRRFFRIAPMFYIAIIYYFYRILMRYIYWITINLYRIGV